MLAFAAVVGALAFARAGRLIAPMKALTIAGIELRRLLRWRANVFFLFVLPMLIILLLGAAFGGSDEARIGVVGGQGGPLARAVRRRRSTRRPSTELRRYATRAEPQRAVSRGDDRRRPRAAGRLRRPRWRAGRQVAGRLLRPPGLGRPAAAGDHRVGRRRAGARADRRRRCSSAPSGSTLRARARAGARDAAARRRRARVRRQRPRTAAPTRARRPLREPAPAPSCCCSSSSTRSTAPCG